MDHRTDKQAALDDTSTWILKKLEKRFGEERLGLNTQEIGQVLDSVMGPAYDDKGTPTPQRQDPAEAARRLIAPLVPMTDAPPDGASLFQPAVKR